MNRRMQLLNAAADALDDGRDPFSVMKRTGKNRRTRCWRELAD